MWNNLFRDRNKEVRVSNAALALDQAHTMVRQMALPLIPERRVKGALELVSRETGISYSKTRKIFYRLTDNILHFEFRNIAEAFKRAAQKQERLYRIEADRLQKILAANERMERQLDLLNQTAFQSGMGADDVATDALGSQGP